MNKSEILNQCSNFKDNFLEFKKYWIIYLIFISVCFLSTLAVNSFSRVKLVGAVFFIVAVLGIFCITYYFSNKDGEFYKVAFVIIVCFGLICSLIVPICDVSDEREHLNRAELTSQGIIFPHWTGEDMGLERTYNLTNGDKSTKLNVGAGYATIESSVFFVKNVGKTVFETNNDTDKINYSPKIAESAFEQNPAYGYLPQALGILVAKLLDLNVIWMLWLGRMFNLICYAGLISLAIKKVDEFKIPLLVVATIPITIYQAASMSIDSMVIGLGILAVAYFIHMCTAEKKTLKNRDIIIFSVITLLLGLCKLPYLAFIFLLLFIPRDNFGEDCYVNRLMLICIVGVAIIGICYSEYSSPTLLHSWRSAYNNVNSTQQIQYLLNNPNGIGKFIQSIFSTELLKLSDGFFNFYGGTPGAHYSDKYLFISTVYKIFFAIVLLAYPVAVKFSKITKIGALLVALIIYVGTAIIQLLTWANVGGLNLALSLRYFIPLFALVPIIVGFNHNLDYKVKFDRYTMVLIVGFLGALILSFATKYY